MSHSEENLEQQSHQHEEAEHSGPKGCGCGGGHKSEGQDKGCCGGSCGCGGHSGDDC